MPIEQKLLRGERMYEFLDRLITQPTLEISWYSHDEEETITLEF
jgi:ribosomal protein L5